MKRNILFALALAGSVLSAPSAHAFQVDLQEGHAAVLGQLANDPVVVSQDAQGGCTLTDLHQGWGQADSVQLAGHVLVLVASTGLTFCNYQLQPLDLDGEPLWIYADPDVATSMYNDAVQGVAFLGGQQNDLLVNFVPPHSASDFSVYGDSGNDRLWGWQNSVLEGAAGNDLFCIRPWGIAERAIGGAGFDMVCGRTYHTESIEYNAPSCQCDPPF